MRKLGVALCWLLLSSCGPSPDELLTRFQPAYHEKSEQLKRAASLVPPAGSLEPLSATALEPPFVYEKSGPPSNADILMFEQLTDPK